jgi:hypothetical protein
MERTKQGNDGASPLISAYPVTMALATDSERGPIGEQERRELARRVNARKAGAVTMLLLVVPVGVMARWLAGPSWVFLSVFVAFMMASVTSLVWLMTLQCPRCRRPLLWDENWAVSNWRWLTLDGCGHCGLSWVLSEPSTRGEHREGAG